MTTIATKEEFDALLKENQAVLFVFFDWSGQAHASLKVFADWERDWRASHTTNPVSFFRFNPDHFQEAANWLVKLACGNDGVEGGFGSVTWLQRGKGLGFIRYAAQAGKDKLTSLTDEYFRSTTAT